MFRNVTLKCLTEIAAVTVTNYDEMFTTLFTQTMVQLEQVQYLRDTFGTLLEGL
jgi:exportin-1